MTKTTSKESLDWAQKAQAILKERKEIKFRSKLEESIAKLLEGLGVSYEYESSKVTYTIEHNYTPDFCLPNYTYLEAKGYWAAADRRKILAVKKQNHEIDLRMVFESPFNKINKKNNKLKLNKNKKF